MKLVLVVALFLQKSVQKEFIWVGTIVQCEGKDSGNYTWVTVQSSDELCSQDSISGSSTAIQNFPNKEKSIIGMQALAGSRFPAGAEVIVENLYLFTSGSLAGKYGYFRTKHLLRDYLKKCSSVLGLSIISFTNVQVLISDKLDTNVLISPTGALDAFRKGATTRCTGSMWGV